MQSVCTSRSPLALDLALPFAGSWACSEAFRSTHGLTRRETLADHNLSHKFPERSLGIVRLTPRGGPCCFALSGRLPGWVFQPAPRVNPSASDKALFIRANYFCSHRAGDGANQGVDEVEADSLKSAWRDKLPCRFCPPQSKAVVPHGFEVFIEAVLRARPFTMIPG